MVSLNYQSVIEIMDLEIKKLADAIKIISQEKEKEILFFLSEIIQEKISLGDIKAINL